MIQDYSSSIKLLIRRSIYGSNKPGLFIVGAQKSGTSSVFHYLTKKSWCCGSCKKEVGFFDKDYNFSKGNSWYESHFPNTRKKNVIYCEATPEYLYKKKVPARIHAYNPNAKILILLRDPVDRAYSAWNMYKTWSDSGVIPKAISRDPDGRPENPIFTVFFRQGCPEFSEYIDHELRLISSGYQDEEPGILRRGLYKEQIERYVSLFGRENVLICGFREVSCGINSLADKVRRLIGLDNISEADVFGQELKLNKRSYSSSMSCRDRSLLEQFYAPHNQSLFEYLDETLAW